jgi:intracellular sulfur oxidation DsrE/DsrF family protein
MADSLTIVSTRRASGFSARLARAGMIPLLALLAAVQLAQANEDVEALLGRDEAPHGVVFEIVSGNEAALDEILPAIRAAIERIRERFPQTEFAVVSHGREQFALQQLYQNDNAEAHGMVKSLAADNVPVHVCETHAGWYGVSAEDFPDYVDVAPTGPGQVNLYRELGYDLILMD